MTSLVYRFTEGRPQNVDNWLNSQLATRRLNILSPTSPTCLRDQSYSFSVELFYIFAHLLPEDDGNVTHFPLRLALKVEVALWKHGQWCCAASPLQVNLALPRPTYLARHIFLP